MVAILLLIFLFGYFQQSAHTDAITDYRPRRAHQITRRIIGTILIVIGVLGVITSLLLYVLRLDGMIPDDSSNLDIQAGFFMFFIVLGSYICNFIPSDICIWKKVCKVFGYTLLCVAAYILCFIPAFWINGESLFLFIAFVIILPFAILLIRISRKRAKRIILPKREKMIKKQESKIIFSAEEKPSECVNAEKSPTKRKEYPTSFSAKVNVASWIISSLLLIICIVFFILFVGGDNDGLIPWLITSFLVGICVAIWAWLNYTRLTIKQYEKFGLAFLISGFLTSISPFSALVLLIVGAMFSKRVFDNEQLNNDLNKID